MIKKGWCKILQNKSPNDDQLYDHVHQLPNKQNIRVVSGKQEVITSSFLLITCGVHFFFLLNDKYYNIFNKLNTFLKLGKHNPKKKEKKKVHDA